VRGVPQASTWCGGLSGWPSLAGRARAACTRWGRSRAAGAGAGDVERRLEGGVAGEDREPEPGQRTELVPEVEVKRLHALLTAGIAGLRTADCDQRPWSSWPSASGRVASPRGRSPLQPGGLHAGARGVQCLDGAIEPEDGEGPAVVGACLGAEPVERYCLVRARASARFRTSGARWAPGARRGGPPRPGRCPRRTSGRRGAHRR
jgi:hypothetical protein